MKLQYDIVVIGGGTAGCVLAARLSEDPNRTVVLVEAGRGYGFDSEPAAVLDTYARAWFEPSLLWPGLRANFRERAATADASSAYSQARILGGGSAVMGMHALRGFRFAAGGATMAKTSDHGIIVDEKGREQPKDKDRAQDVNKTEPGHMPPQPARKEEVPRKGES